MASSRCTTLTDVTTPRTDLRSSVRRFLGRRNFEARRAVAKQAVAFDRRLHQGGEDRGGITVVTVTWNSVEFLAAMLRGVKRFSPADVEIIVVDNHSTDATPELLAEHPEVRNLRLPTNIGHGLALDLAFARARTTKVIALDVDAFPIDEKWLGSVIDPLDAGASIAGAHIQRGFIHPSFLAMRRDTHRELATSFVPIGRAPKPRMAPSGLFMDVGEALSHNAAVTYGTASLHKIAPTSTIGPGLAGTVFGDIVYHNFYSTQGLPEHREASRALWSEAVSRYLD